MVPKRFRFEDIVVENETPADILIKKEEAASGPALGQILEAELAMAVGDWACQNPERWQTLRMRHAHPELTLGQLAQELGISISTVKRHLRRTLHA